MTIGESFLSYCLTITVRFSSSFVNSALTSNLSGHDKAQGKRRYHEIPRPPKGLSRNIHI